MKKQTSFGTRKLVLLGLFTAIVVVLQALSALIRFGPFSITLVLMPITIGAALIGVYAGAWLGFVFTLVVLISGDAAAFLAINPAATVVTLLLRGALVGFAAGGVYKLLAKKSKTAGAIVSALISPIVNTGLFVITVYMFFLPTVTAWGEAAGFENAAGFIFLSMIGINFLIELGVNIILSPSIVRLVQYGQGKREHRRTESVEGNK
jgi:uncharacterized membrane protein